MIPIVLRKLILLKHPDRHSLLEIADNYDNLPIHTAAEEGHIESVKFLIESNTPIGKSPQNLGLFHTKYIILAALWDFPLLRN